MEGIVDMADIAVCLVCYNQRDFISEAIESVLSQETIYSYKIYIGDDCSTDGTTDICKSYQQRYPDIIELVDAESNFGLVGNTKRVFDKIKSDNVKYIAMLDGDDYWTDNNKLQKQCSFLEENEDYGLVFSSISVLYEGRLVKSDFFDVDGKLSLEYVKVLPIGNNTVMFKTKLLELVNLNDFMKRGFMSCDYSMYVVFSYYTKFKSFDDNSAVWRRGHNSVSNPSDIENKIKYLDNDIAQFKYLGERFPEQIPFTSEDEINHRDFCSFKIYFKYNDFEKANYFIKKNPYVRKAKNTIRYKLKVFVGFHKPLYKLYKHWESK